MQLRKFIWPTITDIPSAIEASRQGFWASLWCAGWTLLFVILSYVEPWAIIDAIIAAVIGWGIYKFSRFAAVSGLIVYLGESVHRWLTITGGTKNLVMAAILILMFVNSIRGAFAYHNFKKAIDMPPLPDKYKSP